MAEEYIHIGAKVPKKIKETLKKVAHTRGEDEAGFIRRTLYSELARLGYLSEDEKKALGMKHATT